ncbi:hypothetical protein [Leuconostoc mesenteroides]|nr:hypothetical protein [Leuconostoc mesenteroides]QHM55732.1 hypothetical protein C7M43_00434 [Leuconostoc mesenteroides]BAX73091.1 hypothetical protein LEMES_01648 [Leuconostoc mesenteroides]
MMSNEVSSSDISKLVRAIEQQDRNNRNALRSIEQEIVRLTSAINSK